MPSCVVFGRTLATSGSDLRHFDQTARKRSSLDQRNGFYGFKLKFNVDTQLSTRRDGKWRSREEESLRPDDLTVASVWSFDGEFRHHC